MGFSGRKIKVREPGLRSVKKYTGYSSNSRGRYTSRSFPALANLLRRIVEAAVMAANNSLTSGTWRVYNSVKKHIRECEEVIGRKFRFPMSESEVEIFVA